jgi:hypothetical protein
LSVQEIVDSPVLWKKQVTKYTGQFLLISFSIFYATGK